jgi:Reverse transcriptase (RNA-dependent DNA polymerase)
LSNIVLDELDQELARRGHRFARYADDAKVYVRSERAGQRVMASLAEFIEGRLRLKVNQAKSAVARPEDRHFLGFRLRLDSQTGIVEVLLSERTKRNAMERIRQLTPRNWGEQSWRLHPPDQRVAVRVARVLRDRLRHGNAGDAQDRRPHSAAVASDHSAPLETQTHDR